LAGSNVWKIDTKEHWPRSTSGFCDFQTLSTTNVCFPGTVDVDRNQRPGFSIFKTLAASNVFSRSLSNSPTLDVAATGAGIDGVSPPSVTAQLRFNRRVSEITSLFKNVAARGIPEGHCCASAVCKGFQLVGVSKKRTGEFGNG
jgi:hypothetical protein